jgi:hypothetical protein
MSFGIAAAIIGGGLGLMSSMNQSDAISDAGDNTRAASAEATRAQQEMFNTQQNNSNLRYNQMRSDLSRLFGGNVYSSPNVNLSGGSIFGSGATNNAQLEQMLAQMRGGSTQLTNTADRFNPLMSLFGNTASNQLQQFNSFNPQTMAQDIYSKLTQLGLPQRERERANLESRLLNQGILTSSPGFSQINSLDEANSQSDLARQIQAMLQAREQQQQFLSNATGAAGTMGNLAGAQGNLVTQAGSLNTAGQNLKNSVLDRALQASAIEAGVPINSGQPIPTGGLSVAGAQAQGQANIDAANITNSFWSSLGGNSGFQSGISGLLGNLGGGINPLPSGGGSPINTSGMGLGGADGLFAMLNGYGGGV